MTQGEKTPSQIKEDLYDLSATDIREVIDILKNIRHRSKDLLMIERGRKIHGAIETAIDELESIQKYLADYSIEIEDVEKLVPWA